MLPLKARGNQGGMVIMEYFTFTKAQGQEPHLQIQFIAISRTLIAGIYPSSEVHLTYFTVPADWTIIEYNIFMNN